ncbi:MAG: hypothetical protein HYV27_01090 [Candidatus Hydrogenedentes bacterium]|nr:hypothetical protein [Candidatus Hydrogenedentota bacterium]
MADFTEYESYTRLMQTIATARDIRDGHHRTFAGQVSSFRSAVDALAKGVTGTMEENDREGEKVQEHLKAFLEEIAAAGSTNAAYLADMEHLQKRVDELSGARDAADMQCMALQEELDALRKSSDAKGSSQVALEQRIAELEAAEAASAQALAAAVAAQKSAEKKSVDLEKSLEVKVKSLDSATDGLSAAEERIAGLEAEMAELRESGAIVETLESHLTAMKKDKLAAEEAARTALKQAKDAGDHAATLEKEVAGLKEQLTAAQAQPVKTEELNRLKAAVQDERDRASALEERLKDEMAKGTKASLATQLAEAINEAEESRETVRMLRQELERVRRERDGNVDVPAQIERIKEVWRAQDGAGKMPIGEILRRAGICTSDQIDEALALQKENPSKHIGTILIEHRFASEEAVSQARACQCDAEFITFTEDTVDPAATEMLSQRLANQHVCIPISANEERVVVAIANPMDLVAIEDIERAVNRRVEIVVGTPSNIKRAIEHHYWEPE